jgi:hypothetical protein
MIQEAFQKFAQDGNTLIIHTRRDNFEYDRAKDALNVLSIPFKEITKKNATTDEVTIKAYPSECDKEFFWIFVFGHQDNKLFVETSF